MYLAEYEDFIKLPKGTVFSKYTTKIGIGSYEEHSNNIYILEYFAYGTDEVEVIDYYYTDLGAFIDNSDGSGSPECISECRDGLFNLDKMTFYVYEKRDVEEIINQLQSSLINAYS